MLLVLIPFVAGHRKNKRLEAHFTVSCHDAYVWAAHLLHAPGPGITACLYLTHDALRKYEALSELREIILRLIPPSVIVGLTVVGPTHSHYLRKDMGGNC